MKKLLIVVGVVVGVIALILWVITWFRAPDAVATSAAQPWPGGMGTLESADARYPAQQANEASVKLRTLAKALPAGETVTDFVAREVERGELTIGEPPALPDVSAIRELLLNDTIVWARHEGIGGDDDMQSTRSMQMSVARALVASALAKARGNDPAAWEDLRAVWKLARALDGQPQMLMQTAALTMARMINATAWKMPLPAPAWLGEVQERDNVRPLLESYQYQTASYWADTARIFPTKSLASSVEHDRAIAEEMFNTTQCEVSPRENVLGVDLRFVWRRALRYRAEREATANALRIREGKPIEPTSRCSDGAWKFDGKTLSFAKPIAMSGERDMSMPLTLRVGE